MANNVYIGSRYVPIFDGDWDNTKVYEPLTIVNYNGGSYTSKQTVPAGTNPSNTTYWALTGNYNGQIANLQNQIDSINNVVIPSIQSDINGIQSDINGIQSDIDKLENRLPIFGYNDKSNIILIGDSWTVGITATHGMGYYLPDLLPHDHFYQNSYGGSGFVATGSDTPNKTFRELLIELAGNVGDPNSITNIIVQGGVNDSNKTGVTAAVEAFADYVHTTYPNATIDIMINNRSIGGMITRYNYITNIMAAQGYRGIVRVFDCTKSVSINTWTNVLHANADGYKQSSQYIADLLLGGKPSLGYSSQGSSNGEISTYSKTGITIYEYQNNEDIQLVVGAVNLGTNITIGGDVAIASDKLLSYNTNLTFPFTVKIKDNSGDSWRYVPCVLTWSNESLLKIRIPTGSYYEVAWDQQTINMGNNY